VLLVPGGGEKVTAPEFGVFAQGNASYVHQIWWLSRCHTLVAVIFSNLFQTLMASSFSNSCFAIRRWRKDRRRRA
jgi:hypothetical protein